MKQLLKISEFARLSGFTRKNLIYYDEIGLLSPELVEENGYRLYSYHQLETVSVIIALQEIGMPLKEIKLYLDQRTPDKLLALFTREREHLEEKIHKLQRIQRMIDMRIDITCQAKNIDFSRLLLKECKKESLFASEPIENFSEETMKKTMEDLYERCDLEHMTYGYPIGTIISKENLLEGFYQPIRFFFPYPPEECGHSQINKPSGLYLIGFGEVSSYDAPTEIYKQMFRYIKNAGLEIIGNSYENYLLDEIAVKEPDKYLIKISIQVKKSI